MHIFSIIHAICTKFLIIRRLKDSLIILSQFIGPFLCRQVCVYNTEPVETLHATEFAQLIRYLTCSFAIKIERTLIILG